MSHRHQLRVCLLSTRASCGTTSMESFWSVGMCWGGVEWGHPANLFQGSVRRWASVATENKTKGLTLPSALEDCSGTNAKFCDIGQVSEAS